MKKTTISKTASALVALLIASMLLPVLAFAASFGEFKENEDGTVTGYVYLEQAEFDSITGAVYLDVLDSNGVWHRNALSVGKNTYSYIDNQYMFKFDFDFTVNGVTYNPVKFGFEGAVTDWVYKPETSTPPVIPGPGGWFGGGTTVQNGQIDLGWNTDVRAADLLKAFEQSSNVIVKTQGDYVTLPASALAEAAKTAGRTVTVVNNNGSYELPLSIFDFDALSEELGVDLKDIKIKVEIKKADVTTTSNISKAIEAIGGKQISEAIDFNVTAEANGASIEINDFGQTFVKRTLPVNGSVNANMVTAVAYDAATGQLQFVPSTFTDNDQSVATIYRNSNSVYTVISNDLSFDDIQGHWGQSYIELLGNKLVVNGVGKGLFAPERDINRAEFAALLVRSLGLKLVNNDTTFSDVDSNAWYADVVATAAEAGLVNGYTDGTFRPLATITRQEIAAMVVRAIEFAGGDVKVSAAEADQLLAQYNDASGVTWAKDEMAAAIKSGIVQGTSNTTLRPTSNATRAQSAAMLERYLKYVEFIN